MDGWKNPNEAYFEDIRKTAKLVPSPYFRPPYGKIRFSQVKWLASEMKLRTVMWTILSGDFDPGISGDDCANNVIRNMRPGSIIVFHDSAKAFDKINYALPKVLEEIKRRGWVTEKL
jgi:peptidoglycan/xylan/chitin deacetylase (PgdA/CDA1 family)